MDTNDNNKRKHHYFDMKIPEVVKGIILGKIIDKIELFGEDMINDAFTGEGAIFNVYFDEGYSLSLQFRTSMSGIDEDIKGPGFYYIFSCDGNDVIDDFDLPLQIVEGDPKASHKLLLEALEKEYDKRIKRGKNEDF